MTKPTREVVVGIRMTRADRERTRQAARQLGLDLSTFIRQATLEKVTQVLGKPS